MDPTLTVLASDACFKTGQSIITNQLPLMVAWWDVLRNHMMTEQFIHVWNVLNPHNSLTMNPARDIIYACLGRDA